MVIDTIEPRIGLQVRSCFRCGREFSSENGDRVCAVCRSPRTKDKPLNPKLTFREKQVINLISQGKLNKEIAFELHLTEGTIKEYLNRIFRKLGVSNRTELAVWALTQQQAAQTNSIPLVAETEEDARKICRISNLRPLRFAGSKSLVARRQRAI